MKLAVIGKVVDTKAIEGADRIQQAVVDCADEGTWSGVVSKEINKDDTVVVFLQDAVLPEHERWAFMAKSKWRVRMARFKGVPSECLIVPAVGAEMDLLLGDDLTTLLGVTKHEKPVPAAMAGEVRGNFPDFIPKTNEENFQRLRDLQELMECEWIVSVKYDGTSCTVWNDDDGMHVCSRNLELKEFSDSGASNLYWKAARKFGLERIPPGYALQFEICGPGIQGNPCGYDDLEISVFTMYNIGLRERCHLGFLVHLCQSLELPLASIVGAGRGPISVDQIRAISDGARYENDTQAEGVVFRGLSNEFSFKAISLNYKEA